MTLGQSAVAGAARRRRRTVVSLRSWRDAYSGAVRVSFAQPGWVRSMSSLRRVTGSALHVYLWHGLAEAVQREVAAHSCCRAGAAPPQAGERRDHSGALAAGP